MPLKFPKILIVQTTLKDSTHLRQSTKIHPVAESFNLVIPSPKTHNASILQQTANVSRFSPHYTTRLSKTMECFIIDKTESLSTSCGDGCQFRTLKFASLK